MRRFIATLLALSLLLGGVAWAADNCGEVLPGTPDHLVDGNGDGKNLPQPPSKAPADFCGHCSHGHAHLLGVLPPSAEVILVSRMDHRPRIPRLHLSLVQQPPIQPPRV